MAYLVAHTGRKEIANLVLEWHISQFEEKIKTTKTGEWIELNNVNVGETKWKLRLYPNGAPGAVTQDKVVSLVCRSANETSMTVKVSFSVMKNNSQKDSFGTLTFTRTYVYPEDTSAAWGYGYPKFLKHENINTNGELLSNGTLRLVIKITVYGKEETTIKTNDSQEIGSIEILEKQKFSDHFKEGWMKDDFSDVKIKCGREVFYCHRVILARRSQYFRTMLESGLKESQSGVIDLDCMDVDTLTAILKYIYGGELHNMETNAVVLLEASDKFDFAELKIICENYLITNYIKLNNVIDVLLMADLHKAKNLKQAAMEMIVANSDSIVKQEGWEKKLEKSNKLFIEIFKAFAEKTNVTK